MFLISLCTILCSIILLVGNKNQYVVEAPKKGFNYKWKFKIDKKIFIMFAAILIITSTLRYGWIDTYAYKEMYVLSRGDLMYVNSAPYGVEKGWLYLCYFLNFISSSPKLLLFISALIIISAYIIIIKKYSCDPIFSLIIFFCLLYMDTNNGLRQMVAASITILCFSLLTSNNKKKYLLYIFIIWLLRGFHESVIVCLFVAFLIIGKPLNIKIKAAIILGMLFCIQPGIAGNYLGQMFSDSKYLYYLDMSGGMTFMRAFITGIIPAILAVFYLKKCKYYNIKIDYVEGLLINILFVNSIFILMGCTMQYWNRMAFYTSFAPIVLIPKLVGEMFVKSQRKYIKIVAIILYFIFFAYNIYVNISYGAIKDFYISLI